MANHEQKYCPACNSLFECKAGSISNCQCSSIQLSKDQQQVLREKYTDCLCINCLRLFAQHTALAHLKSPGETE